MENSLHERTFLALKTCLDDPDDRNRQLATHEIVSRYSEHLTEQDLDVADAGAKSEFFEVLVKRHTGDEIPEWWWREMFDPRSGIMVWNAAGKIATKHLGTAIDQLAMIQTLDEASREKARDLVTSQFWKARERFYQRRGGGQLGSLLPLGVIAAGDNPRIHGGYEWWEEPKGQSQILVAVLQARTEAEVESISDSGTWAALVALAGLLDKVKDETEKQKVKDAIRPFAESKQTILRDVTKFALGTSRPLDIEDYGSPSASEEGDPQKNRTRSDEKDAPANATGRAVLLSPELHPSM